MKASSGLFAAAVVTLASAPAFACHRHLLFWHHCNEAQVVAAIPVPLPVLPPVVVFAPAPPPPPMVVAYAEVQPLPPVVYVPPAPAPVPPPPPAPVVVVAAPVVQEVKEEEPSVQRLAVKWSPGISAPFSWEEKAFGPAQFTNNFGVEFRLSRYFALRADLELRSGARSWEIPGIKVSLFPSSRVHPFASASLSLNQVDAAGNKVSIGFMGAAGLDVTLFKYLFVTAEARYNVVPGNCCALPRVTGLIGAGVQFL